MLTKCLASSIDQTAAQLPESVAEVVVVGAGPAGLSAAIALARRGHDVTLLGRLTPRGAHAGEQLSGEGVLALQRACPELDLTRVGLRSPGVKSAWGSRDLHVRSALFEAHGASLTVDRHALEQALLATARSLGVAHARDRVLHVERSLHGIRLTTPVRSIHATFGVDASGRSAALARALGARILRCDRLVAVVAELAFAAPIADSSALVESTRTGFWYSVPISASALVAMYFTDAEQLQGIDLPTVWRAACEGSVHTQQRLLGAAVHGELSVRPACSQRLDHAAGSRFLALGDAAMAWDPLSSSGLTHALCAGEEAVSAIARALAGDEGGLAQFALARQHEFARYLVKRAHYYRAEARFSSAPFWRNRSQPALLELRPRLHPEELLVTRTPGSDQLLAAGLSERTVLAAVGSRARARDIVSTLIERSAHAHLPEELIGALQLLLDRGALARVSAERARNDEADRGPDAISFHLG